MYIYKGRQINSIEDLQLPESQLHGFIYLIRHQGTGQYYIGKKNFFTDKKVPLSKKALPTDKRLKTYKRVKKETDWLSYYGSSLEIKELINTHGKEMFTREILQIASSKTDLTFLEVQYLMHRKDGILNKNCINSNVLGKFYKEKLKNLVSQL